MIGYLCAYLRYYHPAEFITAYLNNANNEEDIKNGSELAQLYGIQIVPPRFGLSKDRYVCDSESKVIAKGISSVKYMNSTVANELYDISQKHDTESFMELLRLMKDETSLDTRQRDILVKIDYFRDFGNVSELSRIVSIFQFFKDGGAKKVPIGKLSDRTFELVAPYGSAKNKDGSDSKSFTILDMPALLAAMEAEVKSLMLPDVDLRTKIQTQMELMGYIDLTTRKPEDRKKLLVTEVYPLSSKAKDSGEVWGYAVQTRSIGTGKTARLTIRANTFRKKPLKRLDIIYAKDLEKNKSGYWYLLNYDAI